MTETTTVAVAPVAPVGEIVRRLAMIAGELAKDGISKDRKNNTQGFNFRGVDDVYGALSPLLAKNGVVITPHVLSREKSEHTTKSGGAIYSVSVMVRYVLHASDGSHIECVVCGEAMDTGDKATTKALSGAYKYMAFQVFCIPVEGQEDADASTPEQTQTAMGRVRMAIAAARNKDELDAAGEMAKHLNQHDRESLRKDFAEKRAQLQRSESRSQNSKPASPATSPKVQQRPEQGEAQIPVDPPFVDDVVQDEAAAEGEEAQPQPDHALAPTKATSDQAAAAQPPLSPHLPSWATPRDLQGAVGKVKDDQQKARTVYLYTEAMISPQPKAKLGDLMYRFLPGGADKPQLMEWTGESWDMLPTFDPLQECVRAALANDIKSRNRICQLGSSMLLALAKDRITEQVFTDLKDLTVRSLVLLRAAMAELQKKGSPE